jgi:glycosyltransferase involved in cell wall biosynthesis
MNRGGAETLIMNLYRNMDREKVQFDFLTCKKGVFDNEITQLGGRVFRIPYITEIGQRGFSNEVRKFLAKHPTYLIIHSHLDKISGFVLRSAKRENVPIRIAHSHNTESEGSHLAKIYKWYAGNYVNRSATHLYACSHAASRWMFGERSGQAHILKNGIDTEKFSFSSHIRDSTRHELGIHEDTFVIGHVGRFSHQKNHLYLLDVFAKVQKELPQSMLVLVGDGALRREIRKKIRALKLQKNVKLLGVREDIPALLQAFDLFVFPSLHEGLPVTLIEAQGAGLPCLISDRITTEVDMEIGLVKYLDLADQSNWTEHILNIAKTEQLREVHRGALSEQGYDIKHIAEQTQISYLALKDEAL